MLILLWAALNHHLAYRALHLNPYTAKKSRPRSAIILTGGGGMDWQKSMDQTMDYVESHLSSEIDYTVPAQLMHCSEGEFRPAALPFLPDPF
jgi:hypothetical protein